MLMIVLVWSIGTAAAMLCQKTAPEIWHWYRWYALGVAVLSTVILCIAEAFL